MSDVRTNVRDVLDTFATTFPMVTRYDPHDIAEDICKNRLEHEHNLDEIERIVREWQEEHR